MLDVFVPLKDLAFAKSRLRVVLETRRRRDLVVAMALDLVERVAAHPAVGRVFVAAGPGWPAWGLEGAGAAVLRESDYGEAELNAVLNGVLRDIRPRRALVLHGDLPLVDAGDLDAINERLDRVELLLCPDGAAVGTNAVGYARIDPPPLQFGPDSFASHCAMAERLGTDWDVYASAGIGSDIDEPGDLDRLLAAGAAGQLAGPRLADWLRGAAPRGVLHGADGSADSSAARRPLTGPGLA